MGASVSIADIYYQIRDQWLAVSEQSDWQLAVWSSPIENLAIIDRFLEIERTPAGSCHDIFFRFETEYTGNNKLFTQQLWEEYHSWFTEELPEEYDLLKALRKEGFMKEDYIPSDIPKQTTAQSLWIEFLRLKSCIHGLEDLKFCIYFPPSTPESPAPTGWFRSVLKENIPEGIRLVTIDYADKPRLDLPADGPIAYLKAKFDLRAAINNEMDKECDTYDSTNIDSRYRKQVRKVMEVTTQQKCDVLDKEVRTLLSIMDESKETAIHLATPLIASQAYFNINQSDKCLDYAEQSIRLSEEAMSNEDVSGYPIWKVAMFQKAAVFVSQKKWKKGIEIYSQVARKATAKQDAFYIMESYRMCGYLLYEQNKKEDAFEQLLLSLAGGSYLEERIRRESTFLYSASLALKLGKDVRPPKDIKILEEQLKIWLGEDWETLVYNEQVTQSIIRRKSYLFS